MSSFRRALTMAALAMWPIPASAVCPDRIPDRMERAKVVECLVEISSLRSDVDKLQEAIKKALEEIAALKQKTGPIVVGDGYLRLLIGDVHYEFPKTGNMNVGFQDYVCFAANDATRPNARDQQKCSELHWRR
jgi:hypothetical protein